MVIFLHIWLHFQKRIKLWHTLTDRWQIQASWLVFTALCNTQKEINFTKTIFFPVGKIWKVFDTRKFLPYAITSILHMKYFPVQFMFRQPKIMPFPWNKTQNPTAKKNSWQNYCDYILIFNFVKMLLDGNSFVLNSNIHKNFRKSDLPAGAKTLRRFFEFKKLQLFTYVTSLS